MFSTRKEVARDSPAGSARPTGLPRGRLSRPSRFVLVGGAAGLIQLGLLAALVSRGVHPLAANGAAYLAAAQVNFVLSQAVTWQDRFSTMTLRAQGRRWLIFHASIAGTGLLNMLVFALLHALVLDLVASASGIGVASVANYLLHDRLAFRSERFGTKSETTQLAA